MLFRSNTYYFINICIQIIRKERDKHNSVFKVIGSLNNKKLKKIIPVYEIKLNFYDRTEILTTEDITIINDIKCPNIEINLLNRKKYENYKEKEQNYLNRAEYMWYIMFQEKWKYLEENIFQECYKKTWDTYYKNGGWDLVAEKMEHTVNSRILNKTN